MAIRAFSATATLGTLADPVATVLPSIGGTVQVGATITWDEGTWTGSPTLTATLWLADTEEGAATLYGAVPTSWPIASEDKWPEIRVSADNGSDGSPVVEASARPESAVAAASGATESAASQDYVAHAPTSAQFDLSETRSVGAYSTLPYHLFVVNSPGLGEVQVTDVAPDDLLHEGCRSFGVAKNVWWAETQGMDARWGRSADFKNGSGTPIAVGDTLTGGGVGGQIVSGVSVTSGTWGGGDAAGYICVTGNNEPSAGAVTSSGGGSCTFHDDDGNVSAADSTRFGLTEYDPADDLHPGHTGSPIVIADGEECTLTLIIPEDDRDPNDFRLALRYVHVHFVHELPVLGAIPPSPSALTKQTRSLVGINWAAFPTYDCSSFWSTSFATILAQTTDDFPMFGARGEDLRNMLLYEPGSSSQYSGHYARAYIDLVMCLYRDDLDTSEREQIIVQMIYRANVLEAMVQRGGQISSGAGQGAAIAQWMYGAAAATGDADLLALAQSTPTQSTASPFWLTADEVDHLAWDKIGGGASTPVAAQSAFLVHVGAPWVTPDGWQTNYDSRYNYATTWVWYELLFIAMVAQMPGGQTGAEALLDGATANDTDDWKASRIAFIDRLRSDDPTNWPDGTYQIAERWFDLYDLSRDDWSVDRWTGLPSQPPYNFCNFSGGDGTISWALPADFSYSTLGYDGGERLVHMERSLNGVQWVRHADVDLTDSISTPARTDYYCGIRLENDAGEGPRSLNYPYLMPFDSGEDRNVVTVTGSASNTGLTNLVAPALHRRLYPAWEYLRAGWSPVSGLLGVNDAQLAIGEGDWSGHPFDHDTHLTYSWEVSDDGSTGWAEVTTGQFYDRTADEAEKFLRGKIVGDNGHGSPVTVYTNVIECPAIQEPPAGWIIDTELQGDFPIDYAPELAAMSVSSADLLLAPARGYSTGTSYSRGAMILSKTSSQPRATIPLSRTLAATTEYELTAQIVADRVSTWTGSGIRIDVQKQSDSLSYFDGSEFGQAFDDIEYQESAELSFAYGDVTVTYDEENDVTVIDVVATFTTGGSDLDAQFYFRNVTSSGGSGGGPPALTSLRLRPAP